VKNGGFHTLFLSFGRDGGLFGIIEAGLGRAIPAREVQKMQDCAHGSSHMARFLWQWPVTWAKLKANGSALWRGLSPPKAF
jgi:hypothetical protein